MPTTLEDLSRLMYETYETAAVNHGWKTRSVGHVPWAFLPVEHKAAMRDAVLVLERIIREDEQAKHDTGAVQSDLEDIMRALDISTHARPYSSHELVRKEILPKIRNMKETLISLRDAFTKNFIEVRAILDEGRNL
jgi:hypothetical protein